jgi:hypothetical protein
MFIALPRGLVDIFNYWGKGFSYSLSISPGDLEGGLILGEFRGS